MIALAVAAVVLGLLIARVIPAQPAAQARPAPDAGIAFPLHTSGAAIVDASGKRVKLNLVNWYGTETPDYVVVASVTNRFPRSSAGSCRWASTASGCPGRTR